MVSLLLVSAKLQRFLVENGSKASSKSKVRMALDYSVKIGKLFFLCC